MLVGCIPNFEIDTLTFATDTGTPAMDTGEAADTGVHPDALGKDADPLDADPLDGDPLDTDPIDADPNDADPIDADPIDADPADNGPVDSGPDCTAGCAPTECAGFVFDDGTIRWQCIGGERVEANCDNNLDDDGDQEIDCNDEPECGCTVGLLCCPNGNCLELGMLCGG